MRIVVIALLAVTGSGAMHCYNGDANNPNGRVPVSCTSDWCFWTYSVVDGNISTVWSCGDYKCQTVGCSIANQYGGCCCKGELCNDVVKDGKATSCYHGVSRDEVTKTTPCVDDWCYKADVSTNTDNGLYKSCGFNMCKTSGCSTDNLAGGCCCKGDLCNGAARFSLLLISLVAAAATWLW